MAQAAVLSLDMEELFTASGDEIARLTGNEAAYVTSGAAAAIALSVLGCITRGDPAAIAAMPRGRGLPTQVVVSRSHRIPYDRAIELVGGKIREIGNVQQTHLWELEAALTSKTGAVLWVAGRHLPPTLSLEDTVVMAHSHGVPVIVDAAAQLPPVSNLWNYTRACGADLVAFSGGKAMRGPQASGLLVGRRDLVAAARANGTPHQRLARALKVGKEEIVGLVAAVQRYVALDHDAQLAEWEAVVVDWGRRLEGLPGVATTRVLCGEAGQPTPRLLVRIDADAAGVSAQDVVDALWNRNPRVAVTAAGHDAFYMAPDTLMDGDATLASDGVLAALSKARPYGSGSSTSAGRSQAD
ncbi:MAG: aminotransferase class V-fold PLP-dependent enzyme [Candidatus Dormibacteraeota bacterium]|nr:aminotransferase class V-fold PLP-dependent enzyme [Candidatus Dormibacteraeota bacterium]